MKRTKKGITLVELVICCAIIALIGGAATALLMSGEHLFSSSADSASNQMELDVLQSYMMGIIPSAKNIGVSTDGEGKLVVPTTGSCIYFDDNDTQTKDDDTFIIRIGSKEAEIRSVASFSYDIIPAGEPVPNPEDNGATETTVATDPYTARAQFIYTVTFKNGQRFHGGFVINNLSYLDVRDSLATALGASVTDRGDLATYPICLSVDTSQSGETVTTDPSTTE